MRTLLLLGLALVLFLLRQLHSRLFAKRQLPLPPGPPKLPLLGNLHQAPKTHPWLTFTNWTRTYGPIFSLQFGPLAPPVIILGSAASAHELLNQRSAKYSDRPRLVMAGELVTKGMHILMMRYNERHRLYQRLSAPVLSPRAATSYHVLQDFESRQMLVDFLKDGDGRWVHLNGIYAKHGEAGTAEKPTKESSEIQKGPGEADYHHHFERYNASFVYSLAYGYRLPTGYEKALLDARTVQDSIAQTAQVGAWIVDSLPILNHLPSSLAPWKRTAERLHNLESTLYTDNLHAGLRSAGWNWSKHLSASREAQGLRELEVAYNIGSIADAALDTTTMQLEAFVLAMLTAPQAQRAAQRALDDVVGRHRLPAFEDRARLPYLDAVVAEIQRWRPIAPGGFPHATTEEDEYMGYRIPKGALVMANHWGINMDEAVFARPEEFVPERWIERPDLPLASFGYGRRLCPGRHVARNSLWVVVARLLWAFEIRHARDERGERIEVDPMSMTSEFVSKPVPFRVVFEPRGEWAREVIEREWEGADKDTAKILDSIEGVRKVNMQDKWKEG